MKHLSPTFFAALLVVLLCTTSIGCAKKNPRYPDKKADLVVFSFDRPLQLYGLLESIEQYIVGIEQTNVIYRSSDYEYTNAYAELIERFPWATFLQQGEKPSEDFKPLVLEATFKTPSKYIIYAVDDILVKDYVDLTECAHQMEEQKAYGFYLRLGLHLTECYMADRPQALPPLTNVTPEIYSWKFCQAEGDWAYPNTVDMTLFDKMELYLPLMLMEYKNPNSFEGTWSGRVRGIMERTGLCFAESKVVNVPLNVVQNTYANRNMQALSASELLEKFKAGLKFDIAPLFRMLNPGVHTEYMPNFIAR